MYHDKVQSIGWVLIAGGGFTLIWMLLRLWRDREQLESQRDDGLVLLTLLDDVYQRLKFLTERTIAQLRNKGWSGMRSIVSDAMGLTQIDVNSKIQDILQKGITDFMSGKSMTIQGDSKQLGDDILKSPLFTVNPDIIAKDASIIVSQDVPYLNKAMRRDRKYKKLLRLIKRERDKFADEAVSTSVESYLDHSMKVNAAWVLAEHALDGLENVEKLVGQKFPTHFMLQLKNIPNQMDDEMEQYRNKVAIAVSNYLNGARSS